MPGLVNGAAANKKQSKNQLRRAKAKEKKAVRVTFHRLGLLSTDFSQTGITQSEDAPAAPAVQLPVTTQARTTASAPIDTPDELLEIEDFLLPAGDPLFEQYKKIASHFTDQAEQEALRAKDEQVVYHNDDNDDIPDEEDEDPEEVQPSAKRRKKDNRLSVAELKAIAKDPMLVEDADRTAADPLLLLSIKAQRNVVPVPAHWSVKREYLSSKRGIEKASFTLPKFIQDTGIQEMREAVLEKQGDQSLKQQQRARVQPKMGKMDLDYGKLYDAFFRHQTKPVLTRYGEVYFEGKENEVNGKHLRPGDLSNELREALSMGLSDPPPWLYQQQRFGAPPGYPGMAIPGLNAPIPYGASWGFESGQYGKPPVDEFGTPLYGGYLDELQAPAHVQQAAAREPVDKTLWGELLPREDSESEADDDDDEDDDDDDNEQDSVPQPGNPRTGIQTPSGTFTPSGITTAGQSVDAAGIQSVGGDFLLRKGREQPAAAQPAAQKPGRTAAPAPAAAYQVLPEQAISNAGFFGGERAYDLSKARGSAADVPVLDRGGEAGHGGGRKRKAGGGGGPVDVSVDVDALGGADGLSREEMKRQYEAALQREAVASGSKEAWKAPGRVNQEDLSSMIEEEGSKRLKKDRETAERRRQGR